MYGRVQNTWKQVPDTITLCPDKFSKERYFTYKWLSFKMDFPCISVINQYKTILQIQVIFSVIYYAFIKNLSFSDGLNVSRLFENLTVVLQSISLVLNISFRILKIVQYYIS